MSKLLPFFDWLNWAISTIWQALIEFSSIVIVPLGWPILIAFCFWNARTQIRNAIDRLLELNKEGARFASNEQNSTINMDDGLENGINGTISDIDTIKKEDPTLIPFIERVQLELNQINPNSQKQVLILSISRKNREIARQTLLHQIYLSQIEAIEFLYKLEIATEQQLSIFYMKHRNLFNGSPYPTFSDWISYLIRFSMVEHINENYKITDVGRTAVKLIETFTPTERQHRLV